MVGCPEESDVDAGVVVVTDGITTVEGTFEVYKDWLTEVLVEGMARTGVIGSVLTVGDVTEVDARTGAKGLSVLTRRMMSGVENKAGPKASAKWAGGLRFSRLGYFLLWTEAGVAAVTDDVIGDSTEVPGEEATGDLTSMVGDPSDKIL